MIRQLFISLLGFLLLGIFSSCEEPLEIEELPITTKPKLVVISNFAEGQSIIVTVAKSRLIGDPEPEEYLVSADVRLFWNDTFLERLRPVIPKDPDVPPYYKTWDSRPMAGAEYTIKVSAEGYKAATARSSIPPSVKITNFDLSQVRTEVLSGGIRSRNHFSAIVDFDDPAAAKNYYHLNISQQVNTFRFDGKDTVITESFLYPTVFNAFKNENSISAHLKGGLLFEDKPGMKAMGISFSVDIDPRVQELGKTYVELRTLSREYYLYHTSLSRSETANPNPLTDPVIVYENIENGYGIFAGYSNSLDSLQYEKK